MHNSRGIIVYAACLALFIGVLMAAEPTGKPTNSTTLVDGQPLIQSVNAAGTTPAPKPSLMSRMSATTTNFFKGMFGGKPTPPPKTNNKPTGVVSTTQSAPTGAVGNVPQSPTSGYSKANQNIGYSGANQNIGYGSTGPVGYSGQP